MDELDADETLVRRLLAAQFPPWAELPIAALRAGGTDSTIFRLGDALSVRLPRRPASWHGLDGEDATRADLDLPGAAVDLAEFLAESS